MVVDVLRWTWTRTIFESLLGTLMARPAAALLTTPTLILRTDDVAATPEAVFADLTEADFSGYGDIAVTPSAPVHEGAAQGGVLVNGVWIATTATPFVPNTLTGVALTDGGTTLYGMANFDTPIAIGGPGQFLDLTAMLGFSLDFVRFND